MAKRPVSTHAGLFTRNRLMVNPVSNIGTTNRPQPKLQLKNPPAAVVLNTSTLPTAVQAAYKGGGAACGVKQAGKR